MENNGNRVREIDDHVSKKYEMDKRLGKGAYGIVWKARSKRSGRVVAVKKIFDAFRNKTDAQRTFREIIFLRAFGDHPNIVKLLNVHRADNNKDLYLVFEFMNTDLQRAIHRRPGILKDIHKKFIMYQLLSATRYMHSGNVIHRDQKPSNVLLDTECNAKIADFGLARSLTHLEGDDMDGCLTDYVATRWYRAPEILLGCKRYTQGVDLWSLGCILGEMLLDKPLFPGNSTLDQIERIFTSGVQHTSTLRRFKQACLTSDYAVGLVDKAISASNNRTSKAGDVFAVIGASCNDKEALDLVRQLLQVIPEERITADEAIRHAYVSKFYNPAVEKAVLKADVVPPLSDDVQLSIEQYRQKLYEIIRRDKAR